MAQYWKPESKANSTNPKDLLGNAKVSYSKVPAVAVAHCAMAMMDGAEKYGAYNWRDKDVIASIYVDAAKRHLDCWFEGQKTASDSKVHHLGHAMACCAILLDAEAKGKLVDDRPLDEADLDFMEKQLAAMSETIKQKRAEKAAQEQARSIMGGTTIITTPNPLKNDGWINVATPDSPLKFQVTQTDQSTVTQAQVLGTCDYQSKLHPQCSNDSCKPRKEFDPNGQPA